MLNGETASSAIGLSEEERFFIMPFVPGVTDKISRTLNEFPYFLQNLNTLKSYIKVYKDIIDREMNSNIVYRINCLSCDASYVGQTSRQLLTRLTEHNVISARTTNVNQ